MQTSTSPTHPYVGHHVNNVARVTFSFIGSVEIISGVVGNYLLLSALYRGHASGKSSFHNLFIANLAIADILSLGYCLNLLVFDLIVKTHPVLNDANCVANGVILCVCLAVSVLSLMSISFSRYLHVCYARLYSRIFSLHRTIAWCLGLWIFALILALTGIESFGYKREFRSCSWGKDKTSLFPEAVVVFCVVPTCFIGYCNLAVFWCWRDKGLSVKKCLRAHHENKDSEERSEGTREEDVPFQHRPGHAEELPKEEREAPETLNDEGVLDTGENMNATNKENVTVNRHLHRADTLDCVVLEDCIVRPPSADRDIAHQDSPQGPREPAAGHTTSKTALFEHTRVLSERLEREHAKEKAFQMCLCVIVSLLIISYFPFAIFTVVDNITGPLPPEVAISFELLLFFNSSVNWIVYGVMNRSFRRGYFKHIRRIVGTCCRWSCRARLARDMNASMDSRAVESSP